MHHRFLFSFILVLNLLHHVLVTLILRFRQSCSCLCSSHLSMPPWLLFIPMPYSLYLSLVTIHLTCLEFIQYSSHVFKLNGFHL